ncbi:MAG: type 1 glutamine amidotransferase, partial [Bdellovibrionota bacterium]
QTEHGWQEIEVKQESPILKGLPKKFHSFEFHSDEVYKLPKGFKVTASSGPCQVQAFDVEDAPMWGIQFHPERDLEGGNRGLDRRLANVPGAKVINRDKAEKVYDPAVGKTIFRNFLRQIWPSR